MGQKGSQPQKGSKLQKNPKHSPHHPQTALKSSSTISPALVQQFFLLPCYGSRDFIQIFCERSLILPGDQNLQHLYLATYDRSTDPSSEFPDQRMIPSKQLTTPSNAKNGNESKAPVSVERHRRPSTSATRRSVSRSRSRSRLDAEQQQFHKGSQKKTSTPLSSTPRGRNALPNDRFDIDPHENQAHHTDYDEIIDTSHLTQAYKIFITPQQYFNPLLLSNNHTILPHFLNQSSSVGTNATTQSNVSTNISVSSHHTTITGNGTDTTTNTSNNSTIRLNLNQTGRIPDELKFEFQCVSLPEIYTIPPRESVNLRQSNGHMNNTNELTTPQNVNVGLLYYSYDPNASPGVQDDADTRYGNSYGPNSLQSQQNLRTKSDQNQNDDASKKNHDLDRWSPPILDLDEFRQFIGLQFQVSHWDGVYDGEMTLDTELHEVMKNVTLDLFRYHDFDLNINLPFIPFISIFLDVTDKNHLVWFELWLRARLDEANTACVVNIYEKPIHIFLFNFEFNPLNPDTSSDTTSVSTNPTVVLPGTTSSVSVSKILKKDETKRPKKIPQFSHLDIYELCLRYYFDITKNVILHTFEPNFDIKTLIGLFDKLLLHSYLTHFHYVPKNQQYTRLIESFKNYDGSTITKEPLLHRELVFPPRTPPPLLILPLKPIPNPALKSITYIPPRLTITPRPPITHSTQYQFLSPYQQNIFTHKYATLSELALLSHQLKPQQIVHEVVKFNVNVGVSLYKPSFDWLVDKHDEIGGPHGHNYGRERGAYDFSTSTNQNSFIGHIFDILTNQPMGTHMSPAIFDHSAHQQNMFLTQMSSAQQKITNISSLQWNLYRSLQENTTDAIFDPEKIYHQQHSEEFNFYDSFSALFQNQPPQPYTSSFALQFPPSEEDCEILKKQERYQSPYLPLCISTTSSTTTATTITSSNTPHFHKIVLSFQPILAHNLSSPLCPYAQLCSFFFIDCSEVFHALHTTSSLPSTSPRNNNKHYLTKLKSMNQDEMIEIVIQLIPPQLFSCLRYFHTRLHIILLTSLETEETPISEDILNTIDADQTTAQQSPTFFSSLFHTSLTHPSPNQNNNTIQPNTIISTPPASPSSSAVTLSSSIAPIPTSTPTSARINTSSPSPRSSPQLQLQLQICHEQSVGDHSSNSRDSRTTTSCEPTSPTFLNHQQSAKQTSLPLSPNNTLHTIPGKGKQPKFLFGETISGDSMTQIVFNAAKERLTTDGYVRNGQMNNIHLYESTLLDLHSVILPIFRDEMMFRINTLYHIANGGNKQ